MEKDYSKTIKQVLLYVKQSTTKGYLIYEGYCPSAVWRRPSQPDPDRLPDCRSGNKLSLDILDCRKDSPVYQEAFLEAQVNGIRILFDLMDGYWYNRPETVFPLYHSADIIFKRSFSSVKNSEVFGAFSEKIHPLGFNYHVFCPGSPLIGTTSKIGF